MLRQDLLLDIKQSLTNQKLSNWPWKLEQEHPGNNFQDYCHWTLPRTPVLVWMNPCHFRYKGWSVVTTAGELNNPVVLLRHRSHSTMRRRLLQTGLLQNYQVAQGVEGIKFWLNWLEIINAHTFFKHSLPHPENLESISSLSRSLKVVGLWYGMSTFASGLTALASPFQNFQRFYKTEKLGKQRRKKRIRNSGNY